MEGDLLRSSAQTWVNTVNCVGIMGKGVALRFKQAFPEMFKDYVARCENGEVVPGHPYLFRTLVPPWILNFPTKRHWRSRSRIEDIGVGLDHLLANYEAWEIESLAMPALGCGHGGLDWDLVRPVVLTKLEPIAIPVELYAPS